MGTRNKGGKPLDKNQFINLTYPDLKRECIKRGMDFNEVVSGDFFKLQGWLYKNHHIKRDNSLLNKFDDWMDKELEAVGASDLIHSSLRLGYLGDKALDQKPKKKEEKKPKKKRTRERTKDGIIKGTKKAMTYSLQQRGLTLEEVTEAVLDEYPEASTKSINIWYKKSAKLNA